DTVQINGNIGSSIDLGSGDDSIKISNNANFNSNNKDSSGRPIIDGGSGTDSLYLEGKSTDYIIVDDSGTKLSLSEYATLNQNGTGASGNTEFKIYKDGQSENQALIVKNIENIVFEGDNASINTETTYQYKINLDADLTDTDGSESLSDITLNNVPENTTLAYENGTQIAQNSNGSYTITPDANGDVTVTLSSQSELDENSLNSIISSVSSVESNGGDTSSTTDTNMTDYTQDIDGGADDKFTVDFDNIELDFDNISATNVETLDLGTGDSNNINVTNIDISDVLNMTDEHELTILGDEGDTVALDSNVWQSSGTETISGNEFNTFTSTADNGIDEIKLIIDSHVDVVNG
ncbi:MAG: hypothetical protein WBG69_06345, partial [Arcobacteraceae bacterium]